MPDDRTPIIDRRDAPQLAAQVEHVARRLIHDWRPGKSDPGRTLATLFGHLMEQVLSRLNDVPTKQRQVFADLAAIEPLPPLPARVPVTFTASPGATAVVPERTVLDAEPPDGDPGPLRYETEEPLTVQPARLIIARSGDRFLTGEPATERWLYLTHPLFELAAGRDATSFTVTAPAERALAGLQAWDGQQWQDLALDPDDATRVTLARPARSVVAGRSAVWLRIPPGDHVDWRFDVALVERVYVPPDATLVNRAPVAPQSVIHPFGLAPAAGDVFELRCDRALSLVGLADVSLVFSGVAATPRSATVVAWEYWDGSGFTMTDCDDTTGLTWDGKSSRAVGPHDGAVSFQRGLPRLAPRDGGWWLRAVLSSGAYGGPAKEITATAKVDDKTVTSTVKMDLPPTRDEVPRFAGVRFAVDTRSAPTPATLVRQDGDRFAAITGVAGPSRPLVLIGFDRPLANRLATLFFEVLAGPGNSPKAPALRWSYSTGAGWQPLGVADGTDSLRRSGTVSFIAPTDMAVREELQHRAAWIKAEPAPDTPAADRSPPNLGLVRLNTTWAVQAVTIASERLGPSTGQPGQRFRTAFAPVLAGEVVEVAESATLGDDSPGTIRWTTWSAVTDLRACGPDDRSYHIDRATGALTFGDGVHGAIPARHREGVRVRYRAGGGLRGDRPAGVIKQIDGTLAGVDKVSNELPAVGGRDAEGTDGLVARTPSRLRHGGRAVAEQDYADLALEASTRVGRAWVVPLVFPRDEAPRDAVANRVEVIVVPRACPHESNVDPGLLADVESYITRLAPAGVTVRCRAPKCVPFDVKATIVAATDVTPAVRAALTAFLDPLRGGPDGVGFAPTTLPQASDVIRVLTRVPGLFTVTKLEIRSESPAGDALLVPGAIDIMLEARP